MILFFFRFDFDFDFGRYTRNRTVGIGTGREIRGGGRISREEWEEREGPKGNN